MNRYVFGKQPIDPKALEYMNKIIAHFKSCMDMEYIFTKEELRNLIMPVLLIEGSEYVIRSFLHIENRIKIFYIKSLG